MFSWLSVLLAVVGGLRNYSGCKIPAMSQSASQGRLGSALATAVIGERVPIISLAALSVIRQRKKVLKSETLQETDKHSAFCTSPPKLAFGECSEVSKLQKQRHTEEWVRPLLRFVSHREWRLVDRRAVCPA